MQTTNVDLLARDPSYADVSYTNLSSAYKSLPRPPAFLFGSVPGVLAQLIFAQFEIGPVGIHEVKGGCISGHGAALYKGTGLTSLLWNIHPHIYDLIAAESKVTNWAAPTRYVDDDLVSIGGPGRTVWGHWLVDFIPRLYVLHLFGYDLVNTRFVLSDKTPGFAYKLLELIGIKRSNILTYDESSELLSCRNLIIPSYLRWGNRFSRLFGDAMKFIINRIESANELPKSPIQANRLFVARTSSHDKRSLTNRSEVEDYLVKRGFTSVEPSSYSILEQIALFKDARQLVGEYGSGLHNAIFSLPKISICALRGTSRHPAFIQSGIAEALDQEIGYVFGETPLDARDQVYSIDLSDLKWALDWFDTQSI